MQNNFLSQLLREPLLHFLALAALLFLLDYVFSSVRKDQIVVDQQTAHYLIKQREDLELRQLTAAERQQTIDAFVEEEILYKEAYKRGLDQGDSRMRRNLILKMRGLLTGDIKAPDEQQLRSYFESNRAKFTRPPTLSLEQVFFKQPGQVPGELLADLQNGLDPQTVGETQFGFGRTLPRLSQRDLVGVFGADTARDILAIENKQWYGPFETTYGIHFLRIVGREPAQAASFEEVKPYLEGDWMMTQSRQAIDQELQLLSDSYDIIIEDAKQAAK